jgi:hypothetical protein
MTEETESPVPPLRVRWKPIDTDKTFDGTVIDVTKYSYIVIPDDNPDIDVRWSKNHCEVIR